MKVAITGKGGVGKTTVAAIVARTLARTGSSVVAVDADPNPNLAIALGLGVDAASRIQSVVNVLLEEKAAHQHDHDHDHDDEKDHEHESRPQGAEELLADLGVLGPDGVRLLQTGRIERPSEGCLCCGSHRTSRKIFQELDSRHRVVVADLEAGVNDLMWVWPKEGDVVLVVAEPYNKSLEVARRALEVTRQLGVTDVMVVANRVTSAAEASDVRSFLPGPPLVVVPDDPAVMEAAVKGLSVVDTAPGCPAVQALSEPVARLRALAGLAGRSPAVPG